MEKIKKILSHKIFKILKWVFFILVAFYIILVAIRVVHFFNQDKIDAQVEKIYNTKLTMDDVMGVNLPPDPGYRADLTIEGVDANQNGIRDDVELAIFKEYPNSAKTRAALLQYALAIQMQVTQKILNTTIATEIVTELSRADTCLADTLVPGLNPEFGRSNSEMEKIDFFVKFLENKQFNNEARRKAEESFYENIRSYGDSTNVICDIDYSKLPN